MPSDPTNVRAVVDALSALVHALRSLADSPHTRELRARAESYEKGVRQWMTVPPSEAQRSAMADLVRELRAKADEAMARSPLRTSASLPSPKPPSKGRPRG